MSSRPGLRAAAALFCALIFSPLAHGQAGQAPAIDGVAIRDYGIYTADTVGAQPAPDVAVGSIAWVQNEQLRQKSRAEPGQMSVHFGYRYDLRGAPKGASVKLRAVTIFPPGGIRNPATGKHYDSEFYLFDKVIGQTSYRDYAFDHPWEIAPGLWTFELWYGARPISSEKFLVVLGPMS